MGNLESKASVLGEELQSSLAGFRRSGGDEGEEEQWDWRFRCICCPLQVAHKIKVTVEDGKNEMKLISEDLQTSSSHLSPAITSSSRSSH